MTDRKLCFEKSESLLDKSHEIADLRVGALRQASVEPGGDPEYPDPLGKVGGGCEPAQLLDKTANGRVSIRTALQERPPPAIYKPATPLFSSKRPERPLLGAEPAFGVPAEIGTPTSALGIG